ncbi:MAG: FAD:protein FMN transferase [Deferribacterota bacterium]|nr:FAD:protein FMN transferase [Deferribacterota bacterium]
MWKYITYFIIVIVLFSCESNHYITKSYYKLGTLVDITIPVRDKELLEEIESKLTSLEKFINSNTEKINSAPINTKIYVDKAFIELLKEAKYFYNLTRGHFDITIYTITSLYGFPEGPYKIPDIEDLTAAKKISTLKNLTIKDNYIIKKENILIDTSSYTKGYIVDRLKDFLKEKNINSALINAGGDIYAIGSKGNRKWRIAIENPYDNKKFLSIINLENKAIATSGDYRRFFYKNGRKINHIFDGITKESCDNYKSLSVIAKSTKYADGLATAFYLLPLYQIGILCKKTNSSVLVYTMDNKTYKFCGFQHFEKIH